MRGDVSDQKGRGRSSVTRWYFPLYGHWKFLQGVNNEEEVQCWIDQSIPVGVWCMWFLDAALIIILSGWIRMVNTVCHGIIKQIQEMVYWLDPVAKAKNNDPMQCHLEASWTPQVKISVQKSSQCQLHQDPRFVVVISLPNKYRGIDTKPLGVWTSVK